jgi:hypothetical protein
MKNRPTPATEWTARGGRRDGVRYRITMTALVMVAWLVVCMSRTEYQVTGPPSTAFLLRPV